jgi:flavin-binding protein dodecin
MNMSVAKITEISSTSNKSFEHAVEKGIERASKTIKNITGAWVADQSVNVENGKVASYQVRMKVTFILK